MKTATCLTCNSILKAIGVSVPFSEDLVRVCHVYLQCEKCKALVLVPVTVKGPDFCTAAAGQFETKRKNCRPGQFRKEMFSHRLCSV